MRVLMGMLIAMACAIALACAIAPAAAAQKAGKAPANDEKAKRCCAQFTGTWYPGSNGCIINGGGQRRVDAYMRCAGRI